MKAYKKLIIAYQNELGGNQSNKTARLPLLESVWGADVLFLSKNQLNLLLKSLASEEEPSVFHLFQHPQDKNSQASEEPPPKTHDKVQNNGKTTHELREEIQAINRETYRFEGNRRDEHALKRAAWAYRHLSRQIVWSECLLGDRPH